MECTVKSLHGVKVTGLKFCGKKSNHVNGWCGPGQVQSLSDFDSFPNNIDSLNINRLKFLKPYNFPNHFDNLNIDKSRFLKL